MKVWEYCRDVYKDYMQKMSMFGERKEFDWEKFAEDGVCGNLNCKLCPMTGNCPPVGDGHTKVEFLNREILPTPNIKFITHRRMTNKELARWLAQNPGRELKREWNDDDSTTVSHCLTYSLSEQDKEVEDGIYIREGDSPWFVPFVEE